MALSKNPPSTILARHGFAVIFDMDGTLVDNTPFHFEAWQELFRRHHLPKLGRETYQSEISGIPVAITVKKYFGDINDAAALPAIVNEKQELYRQAFQPYVRPINGLENFLIELKSAGIRMAVATSSDIHDVDFIFNTINIRPYFDAIIIGSMVSQPKPSPLIFLKAADQLNIRPGKCVVFEDSASGLKAGKDAGMKVVGITTSLPAAAISQVASLVINDYADLTVHKLATLFEQ